MSIMVENIGDWRGSTVVDVDGTKIGKLEDIYVDTTTDNPVFGVVKVGVITSHRLAFVPLRGALVGPGHVRVAYSQKAVKSAPALEPGGDLPADAEHEVYAHYELPYEAPATPNGRRLARR